MDSLESGFLARFLGRSWTEFVLAEVSLGVSSDTLGDSEVGSDSTEIGRVEVSIDVSSDTSIETDTQSQFPRRLVGLKFCLVILRSYRPE